MEIKQLNLKDYEGQSFEVKYETKGYYALEGNDMCVSFTYKQFPKSEIRGFEDRWGSEWLEDPVLFGMFDGEVLVGMIEGSMESWNHRFRISNLLVFQNHRHKHIGSKLLQALIKEAKRKNARMVVLETQSCNIPAIFCYRRLGFEFIGFDRYAYSNEDVGNHEVRMEFGLKL